MRVSLNGFVIPSDDQWLYDWFGIGAFSPATIRQALADNPEGEDLELEINSGGGSVFAGFEMYSLLREAKCPTVAIVQSLAGSAASTVMAGCREVRMSPVAQVMVHLPSTYAEGNQNDMKHEAKVLEQITQSILNGYEVKCAGKATRERLDKLIRAESWLTAQEAVELGLADRILGQEAEGEVLPQNIVNAAGVGIRALANSTAPVMDAAALRERYEELVRNGAAPAEGHPVTAEKNQTGTQRSGSGLERTSKGAGEECPEGRSEQSGLCEDVDNWQARARLDIEKMRF